MKLAGRTLDIRGEKFSDIQRNFKFLSLNKRSLLIVQAITGKINISWLSRVYQGRRNSHL